MASNTKATTPFSNSIVETPNHYRDKQSRSVASLKDRYYGLFTRLAQSNDNDFNFLSKLENLNALEADIHSLWEDIYSHYTQPHRHYHTLDHLMQMFDHFDEVKPILHNTVVVELAIWYHDIIYQPTLNNNEQQSADYFKQQLISYLPPSLIRQVESLIMMTASHQLLNPNELAHNPQSSCNIDDGNNGESHQKQSKCGLEIALDDARYFLDMDLAILGAKWEVYTKYATQVRLEYQHIPLVVYKKERSAILNKFLERDRLYFSKEFFNKYEQRARQNIGHEIQQLLN